jgi:hypothetical protein
MWVYIWNKNPNLTFYNCDMIKNTQTVFLNEFNWENVNKSPNNCFKPEFGNKHSEWVTPFWFKIKS